MPERLPAISLVAVPGRRRQTLDIAREVERRGFSGIYMPSRWSNMAQCVGLALTTERIRFGTAIAPIYAQTPEEFAMSAAYIHEVSSGRFRFGIGVAHGPTHQRLGVAVGKPLADTRAFVEKLRSFEGIGDLPPVVLAALRRRMVALAAEIAQGVLFANASLSHMAASLSVVPSGKRNSPDFLVGNMLPVCIADDESAALALHRRRLVRYVLLPNYRNYWKEAGYGAEMAGVERAIAEERRDDIPRYLTDRWVADNTLSGSAAKVRDRLAAWYDAGVDTPVLVPNSLNGNQLTALDEIFAAFAR
ncbi:MAG TPA: LLM class flavin-dependent oxidoreductase [Stellaceae bacterium]|jgi:alkanesulfonate monooxygenase SsuD/methylene tetrahydromethanopterin reductase-like flavin-dependent oxidoreductase (luciferase family)|nr:LLM class flavin-dependent oxidoreductase [Stellaceae bacterium]